MKYKCITFTVNNKKLKSTCWGMLVDNVVYSYNGNTLTTFKITEIELQHTFIKNKFNDEDDISNISANNYEENNYKSLLKRLEFNQKLSLI